jgi:hypothetical protein
MQNTSQAQRQWFERYQIARAERAYAEAVAQHQSKGTRRA